MKTQFVDGLARRTGALQDRRTSLKALAAAALMTAAPFATEAKPKAGKKVKQQCKRQVPTCEVTLSGVCQPGPGVQECLDATAECCAFLGRCNAAAAMECVITNFIA